MKKMKIRNFHEGTCNIISGYLLSTTYSFCNKCGSQVPVDSDNVETCKENNFVCIFWVLCGCLFSLFMTDNYSRDCYAGDEATRLV